jgi:hypothetical protein
MNFDREKKLNRLLLHTARVHDSYKNGYLKVPIEMIEFAFRERKISEVGTYLACQSIYSGKAEISAKTTNRIAKELSVSNRTVYRALKWLFNRDWIGKDPKNGWYFFRGLDWIHNIEGFKYTKSALLFPDQIKELKGFFIGAIISNFIQKRLLESRETGTDQKRRRSEQSCFPVSLTIVEKLFNVSEKTAFNYRKLAEKQGFIKMYPNLKQVAGISPKDITHLKQNQIERIDLRLFGSSQSISVSPAQLKTDKGFIYAQLPNLITPKVLIGKRNMSRSKTLTPSGLC